MRIKYLSCAVVLLLLLFSVFLHAQSKNSIILIDGVPSEVVLGTDGKILQIIKTLPNYMSEYDDTKIYKKPVNTYSPSNDLASYGVNSSPNLPSGTEVFKVVYFKNAEAVFSEATIQKLNEVADRAKQTNSLVMLSTQYSNKISGCGLDLTKNRVQACIDYLIIKGIDQSKIAQAVSETHKGSAKIEIFLK